VHQEAVRPGHEFILVLLEAMNEFLQSFLAEIETTKKADWEEFEPFLNFAIPAGKKLFKDQIDKLIAFFAKPFTTKRDIFDQQSRTETLQNILQLLKSNNIPDNLKSAVNKLRIESFQKIIEYWISGPDLNRDFFTKEPSELKNYHDP
jgi:hypothetical protein